MNVTSREFQRNFAEMKARAMAGEKLLINSDGDEFVFVAAKRKSWQGALKGKGEITGDIFSTGQKWESSK